MDPKYLLKKQTEIKLNTNLNTAIEKFQKNPSKNMIHMVPFIVNDMPLNIVLKGKMASDKIHYFAFENKAQFSFPMTFDDEHHIKLFERLARGVETSAPDWPVNNPALKDLFYVRLGYNQKTNNFKTEFNCDLTPKNLEDHEFCIGQSVTVTTEVKAWYNLKDEKAGVSLNVTHVKFWSTEGLTSTISVPRLKTRSG